MSSVPERSARRYLRSFGEAVLATIAATLVRLALAPLVGSSLPFATHFAAGVLLAWFRGFGPAAVSIVLSAFAGAYYILGQHGDRTATPWGRSESAAVIGFAVVALTVSFLIDFQRRTLSRAKAAERVETEITKEKARLLERAQEAQDELRRSNLELRMANGDLEVFGYSVSHDLKEPLRALGLFSELLQRNTAGQLQDDDASLLMHILAAARRMNLLVDRLAPLHASNQGRIGTTLPGGCRER